jgi:hypothetical protein
MNKTPRGKLLQMSIKHPELIDAVLANLAQYYYKVKEEKLWNQTIIGKMMPFDKQMKYKMSIYSNGTYLLYTKSVVIKVCVNVFDV